MKLSISQENIMDGKIEGASLKGIDWHLQFFPDWALTVYRLNAYRVSVG